MRGARLIRRRGWRSVLVRDLLVLLGHVILDDDRGAAFVVISCMSISGFAFSLLSVNWLPALFPHLRCSAEMDTAAHRSISRFGLSGIGDFGGGAIALHPIRIRSSAWLNCAG